MVKEQYVVSMKKFKKTFEDMTAGSSARMVPLIVQAFVIAVIGAVAASPARADDSVNGSGDSARDFARNSAGDSVDDSACDSIIVMFWNLENFFDWRDGGCGDSDREFSSFGQRRWTKSRFYTKCSVIAKTFMWIEDVCGRAPDAAGFAEVENRFVLQALIGSTLLRKYGYEIVHYDSPDPRGIDVALIYRNSVFRKISSRPVKVSSGCGKAPDQGFLTRDILYVALELAPAHGGKVIHFLVNHHPSKYGGADVSEPKRAAAVGTMVSVCDSVRESWGHNGEYKASGACSGPDLVCMGDFNDTPDNPILDLSGQGLENKAFELFRRGEGTIRYKGIRDMIDMFFVSESLADESEMSVCRIPFLTVRDGAYPGEKPFRTYSGPRYIGGVSDHCPILLKIKVVLSDDIGNFER